MQIQGKTTVRRREEKKTFARGAERLFEIMAVTDSRTNFRVRDAAALSLSLVSALDAT